MYLEKQEKHCKRFQVVVRYIGDVKLHVLQAVLVKGSILGVGRELGITYSRIYYEE